MRNGSNADAKHLSTSSLVLTVLHRNSRGSTDHGGGMGCTRFLWNAPGREGKEEGSEAKLKQEKCNRRGQARHSMASGLAWADDPSPEKTKMANEDTN